MSATTQQCPTGSYKSKSNPASSSSWLADLNLQEDYLSDCCIRIKAKHSVGHPQTGDRDLHWLLNSICGWGFVWLDLYQDFALKSNFQLAIQSWRWQIPKSKPYILPAIVLVKLLWRGSTTHIPLWENFTNNVCQIVRFLHSKAATTSNQESCVWIARDCRKHRTYLGLTVQLLTNSTHVWFRQLHCWGCQDCRGDPGLCHGLHLHQTIQVAHTKLTWWVLWQ